MKSIASELSDYGIPANAVVEFGANPTHREVRYLDLFRTSDNPESEVLPTGVIESAARPSVYFKVDDTLGSLPLTARDLQDLVRTLACRADARFLAIISPGIVTVYKIGFFKGTEDNQYLFRDTRGSFKLRNLISGLDVDALTSAGKSDARWLEGHLFQLMKGAAKVIRGAAAEQVLSNGDVISLIGRALFTRFLADRDILKNSELENISHGANTVHQLLATPVAASATFRWLDKTFNGDLLHLSNSNYDDFFRRLGDKAIDVCRALGNIMWSAPDGQLSLDWGGLRFKHIPVDVLSQVYEHFAHENFPDLAKKTSIHYTPRGIAELVVDGTFTALPAEQRAGAKVLDAAAGAGVFLVLSFRRLVGELWVHQHHRPTRKQIRKILNTQLCGLDINAESLKVTALSLYLAALELDPDPQPLSDLKFDALFDKVLHCVSKEHLTGPDAHLGSLAIGIPEIGKFDIVLGNPPWTEFSGKDKKYLDALAANAIKPFLIDAEFKQLENLVPRQAPDVAFLWKSLQWCKPGGSIGYLLDARLLFNVDHFEARRLLFTLLRVTGLLNATALRKEKRVWPSHDKPFCAFVAINSKPNPENSFYYLNPNAEAVSKKLGEIRLDPSAAMPVPIELIKDCPFALKVLFKGSAFDLSLIQRLTQSPRISLDEYSQGDHSFEIRQGYMVAAKDQSANSIADLPCLEADDQPSFEVHSKKLVTIRTRYPQLLMQRPRQKSIFKGPLLLFRQAPKFDRERRGAIWCEDDVAYSFSYYGLPIRQRAIGEYLFVLSYSDLFVYWALLTSAKFGIERETFYMEDIRSFPIKPFVQLSEQQRIQCHGLADQIRTRKCPWTKLEEFVKAVYRLSDLDWQLITDTLTYASPYSQSLKRAATSISERAKEVIEFTDEIRVALDALKGESFAVRARSFPSLNGWLFCEISIAADDHSHTANTTEADLQLAHQLTDEQSFWTTRLRFQMGSNHWLIGQPNEARFWSKSKARLLALQLHEAGLFSSDAESA
jgi:N-6 DNA Methylase